MSKRILLFGASGAIGSRILTYLMDEGHEVTPVVRVEDDKVQFLAAIGRDFPRENIKIADVTDSGSLRKLARELSPEKIDTVVYAVGYCPPQGMWRLMTKPDSAFLLEGAEALLSEGFSEVWMNFFGPKVTFAVVGSAVTRLLDHEAWGKRPPFWDNMKIFAFAEKCLDDVIEVYRHHSTIHLIKPGAVVDTPFHQGPTGMMPVYPGVTREEVAQALSNALKSPTSVTLSVKPKKPNGHDHWYHYM